ncbi:MAG: DinB family protein [Anaerolineae bacterium]|jgi:hypothetical protein
MTLSRLFLERYDPLTTYWLPGVLGRVNDDQMRRRPHPRCNSIAWILWHIARVEDAGLNRFVADDPQVFDEGGWAERMNVPLRHHGSGMTLAEVDDLSARIDLAALRAYADAVQARTRAIVADLDAQLDADPGRLDAAVAPERLRAIVFDEGLARSDPDGLFANYTGWSRGKCLMTFGLTHPYQHLGEMEVLTALLGVEYG